MKRKLKTYGMRSISFVILSILLFVNYSFAAVALPMNDDPTQSVISNSNPTSGVYQAPAYEAIDISAEERLIPEEKTFAELQAMTLQDVILPETVTLEMAEAKGHVNRLYSQESLQSIVFQNQSGNMTAYVYSQPVKYVANDGTIRDKDTAITSSPLLQYRYAMVDNDIEAYFSSSAVDGIAVDYNGVLVVMKPIGAHASSAAQLGNQDNILLYPNAFGSYTALKYETQLNGVKEDIVLLLPMLQPLSVQELDIQVQVRSRFRALCFPQSGLFSAE